MHLSSFPINLWLSVVVVVLLCLFTVSVFVQSSRVVSVQNPTRLVSLWIHSVEVSVPAAGCLWVEWIVMKADLTIFVWEESLHNDPPTHNQMHSELIYFSFSVSCSIYVRTTTTSDRHVWVTLWAGTQNPPFIAANHKTFCTKQPSETLLELGWSFLPAERPTEDRVRRSFFCADDERDAGCTEASCCHLIKIKNDF